jgi:hypothetical protein
MHSIAFVALSSPSPTTSKEGAGPIFVYPVTSVTDTPTQLAINSGAALVFQLKANGPETCYEVCTMLRRWPAAATFVALVLACASPTLPLPPPEAPEQEVVDATHVKLTAGCGGALQGAQIEVLNQTESDPNNSYGSPTWATDCGSWFVTVFARTNDRLQITQTYGTTLSLPTEVCVTNPCP